MNINDIKDLVKFIKSNKIKDFYYKKGDEEISITLDLCERLGQPAKKITGWTGGTRGSDMDMQISGGEQADLARFSEERARAAEIASASAMKNEKLKEIVSPFVGSFYRSPSPDKAAFVEVDSIVEKGSPVCIVEAMKIMNEIEVDMKCKIVSILVENGQLVEFGQPLFVVEPL